MWKISPNTPMKLGVSEMQNVAVTTQPPENMQKNSKIKISEKLLE